LGFVVTVDPHPWQVQSLILLPVDFSSGKLNALKTAWEDIPGEVRQIFIEAGSKREALNSIHLGSTRKVTVAETILRAVFAGVSFATQAAAAVSPEAPATRFDSKPSSTMSRPSPPNARPFP
jgi:hypothetical protein